MKFDRDFWLENADVKLVDSIYPIIEFFDEAYLFLRDNCQIICCDNDHLNDYLQSFRSVVQTEKIPLNLENSIELISEYKFVKTYGEELSSSLYDFVNSSSDETKESFQKWLEIICKMFSYTRMVLYAKELESYSYGKCDKKMILAVGSGIWDLEEKLIFDDARSELEHIWGASTLTNDYFVVPLLGCSFQEFCKMMSELKASIVHISGHGNETSVQFLNETISYDQFVKAIEYDLELAYINCCCSYEFVRKKCLDNCQYTIAFNGDEDSGFAASNGAYFYIDMWQDNLTLPESLEKLGSLKFQSEKSVEPIGYYVLHK